MAVAIRLFIIKIAHFIRDSRQFSSEIIFSFAQSNPNRHKKAGSDAGASPKYFASLTNKITVL
ncbi:MAG: hypothetical protein D6714_10165 [Bacteroidetes bacterium]|nr:MAG: hypothetical protein D6714_10165 [Bacteroidota bacterium]